MNDEAYWAGRLARFGHTGWSDAAVYAYDQQLRLAALARLLDDLPPLAGAAALDFGCGVGDFCALLAPRCRQVVGHDLSAAVLRRAAHRQAAPNIAYEASLDAALAQPPAPYALVLSVTVLQHVVDDAVLAALLRRLAGATRAGGHLLVLETFAGGAAVSATGPVRIRRRELPALLAACAEAGWVLRSQRGFYHPSESPTPQFMAYRRRPLVRLLSRGASWGLPGAVPALEALARPAAARDGGFLDRAGSPTSWLVFQRAGA